MKKRGRKRKNDLYFGEEEEKYVKSYLECDDPIKRNYIYEKHLKNAFNKMIESIIRRYKLYRDGISFEELHSDTLSFLITRFHKFNPDKNKKAYSYYGTICKNYLLGKLISDDKKLKQMVSYEDVHRNIEENEEFSYQIDDNDNVNFKKLINRLIASVNKEIELLCKMDSGNRLYDNEKKVGYALIEILNNWDLLVDSMKNGNKYNKNIILETIRNYTGLNTKDVRISMKRYKSLYFFIKNDIIENDDD